MNETFVIMNKAAFYSILALEERTGDIATWGPKINKDVQRYMWSMYCRYYLETSKYHHLRVGMSGSMLALFFPIKLNVLFDG